MKRWLLAAFCASALMGCADRPTSVVPDEYADLKGAEAKKVAVDEFNEGLASLAAHDDANDWTVATCNKTAKTFAVAGELFLRVDKNVIQSHAARYNAALVYERCAMTKEARQILSDLVADDPEHHRAVARLAVLRFEKGGDLDAVIADLESAISLGKFQNVDALVSLAAFQMRRAEGSDMAEAKLNLQRALAIDDGHMAALNQLAIYYLEQAGGAGRELQLASANTTAKSDNQATLELAALICSQAKRKNPSYAPIHNTAGLVATRLGDLSAAAASFAKARTLDPRFFEAHMNYAAVNMQFRGFENAEKAYQQALKIDPKSYDAMLGLSLSLRGQAGDAKEDEYVARALKLLHKAKAMDGARPEAFFNEAVLVQEYHTRNKPPKEAIRALENAKTLFESFLERADDSAAWRPARTRAKERLRDIDEMFIFLGADS